MRIFRNLSLIILTTFTLCLSLHAWSLGRPFQLASSNDVLTNWPASNAIDGNTNTSYSSNIFSSSQNTRNTYLATWSNSQQSIGQLVLAARMLNGIPMAFPVSYDIQITDPTNSFWLDLGIYTDQPNAQGYVTVNLPAQYKTWGVLIIPKTLGVDNYGNHYFQMAEVTWNPTTGDTNIFNQTVLNFVNTYDQTVQPQNVAGLLYSGQPDTPLPIISPPALGQNPTSLPSGHWVTSGGGAGYTMNTANSMWNSSDTLIDINPQYYPSPQPYPFRAPNTGLQFSMDFALYYLWINNAGTGGTTHGLVYFWFMDNSTHQAFWLGANLFDVRGQQSSPYYRQFDNGTSDPNLYQDLSFRGNEYLTPLPGSSLITYSKSPNLLFYGFTISESQFSSAIADVNNLVKEHPGYGKTAYSTNTANYSIIGVVFNCEVNRVQPNNTIQGVMSLEINNMSVDMLH